MPPLGDIGSTGDVKNFRAGFEQLRIQVITVEDLLTHDLPEADDAFAAAFDRAMAAKYSNARFRPRLSEIAQQLERARYGLGHIEAMNGVGPS